jgi:hypothetical protein
MSIWHDIVRVIDPSTATINKLTHIDTAIMQNFGGYDSDQIKIDESAELLIFNAGVPRYMFDLLVLDRGVKMNKMILIGPFEHIRQRMLLKNVSLESMMRLTASCHVEILIYLEMAAVNIKRKVPNTMDINDINTIATQYILLMRTYEIINSKLLVGLIKYLNFSEQNSDSIQLLQILFSEYNISSCITTQICSKINCKKILEKIINTADTLCHAVFCIIVHEELNLTFKLADLIIISDISMFVDACLYLLIYAFECVILSESKIVISETLKFEIKKFLVYYEVINILPNGNYCLGNYTYYNQFTSMLPILQESLNRQIVEQMLLTLRPIEVAT